MGDITTKDVRSVTESMDRIVKYYKEAYNPEEKKAKRNWRTYGEERHHRMSLAAKELKGIIKQASEGIVVARDNNRGRPPKIGPEEKTLMILIEQIFRLSNRKMSEFLFFFTLMTGDPVCYKTIERAYSNPLVQMILHNMLAIMDKEKGIVAKGVSSSGDGTGYSLSVKKHYADEKDKCKNRKDFVYYFSLLDLDTRMYVCYGYSRKSEKDAYNKARAMLEARGIKVSSVRLDRYYSNKSLVNDFGKDTVLYIIPKKNATVRGSMKWKKTLKRFVSETYGYLKEYYRRNLSESMFSFDKRMFGSFIRQRRDDRIDLCLFARTVMHNLFWMFG